MNQDKKQHAILFAKGTEAVNKIQNYEENPELFEAPTEEDREWADKWERYLYKIDPDISKKVENTLMLYLSGLLFRGIDGVTAYFFYRFLTRDLGLEMSVDALTRITKQMKHVGLINIGKGGGMYYLTAESAKDWAGIEKPVGGVK